MLSLIAVTNSIEQKKNISLVELIALPHMLRCKRKVKCLFPKLKVKDLVAKECQKLFGKWAKNIRSTKETKFKT